MSKDILFELNKVKNIFSFKIMIIMMKSNLYLNNHSYLITFLIFSKI